MIEYSRAKELIKSHVPILGVESREIGSDLVGYVMAERILSGENVPAFRASIVDGYAVIADDGAGIYQVVDSVIAGDAKEETTDPEEKERGRLALSKMNIVSINSTSSPALKSLPVENAFAKFVANERKMRKIEKEKEIPNLIDSLKRFSQDLQLKSPVPPDLKEMFASSKRDLVYVKSVNAGDSITVGLKNGQVARITTGASVPVGGTAVVMVEDTKLISIDKNGEESSVEVLLASNSGDNIREIGSDVSIGELLMEKGEVVSLLGAEIALLSSVGVCEVKVYRKPRVGVLSTGNEVVDAGGDLRSGHIRDSNRPSLIAAIRNAGFEVVDLGIVVDEYVFDGNS
jgi:molybdopterin biosynthesis enzyme